MPETVYKKAYEKGYNYLKKTAEKNGARFYEIVEDNYEYDYGLTLIVYMDRQHTDELYHECIDLNDYV